MFPWRSTVTASWSRTVTISRLKGAANKAAAAQAAAEGKLAAALGPGGRGGQAVVAEKTAHATTAGRLAAAEGRIAGLEKIAGAMRELQLA